MARAYSDTLSLTTPLVHRKLFFFAFKPNNVEYPWHSVVNFFIAHAYYLRTNARF